MELRSRNKAIRPSTEVVDLEEGTGINPDEEPYAISSDDDSIGSEFQGDEEEEEELEEVVANDDLPNPVPVLAIVNLPRASKKRKKPDARKEKVVLLWETWEKEQNSWIDEHMSEDVDLDQHNAVIAETAEPPSDLIMPLLRYQKEFLAWATKQEQSVAGGILADEMGMGKTIQAISLVLARREVDRAQFGEAAGCTLVLCPLVAVSQWLNEIARFTSPGSTKVLVYHGAKRAKNIKEFMNYDFVLTTYSTVESEYRRNIMPSKVQCAYCSKSFYPKKLVIHLRYFCGPSAVKTAKQSKQKRKKTSDSSSQQGKEADAGEDKKLKKSKKKTKQTVEKDQLGSDDKEKSLLHSVKWNRIILDEAHYIKERRSNTARAVFALEATYRWALSGTPLQNRVGELYSLIRFLQIRPYSYYFCKDCDCRILDYVAHQSCPHCPHNAVRHFCWWNKYVAKPITVYGSFGLGKRAMILLKHKVLKDILLRRTKLGRAADLALPPRIITLRRDTLDVKEFDYYESLYKNSQAEFNTYIEAGTLMNNYAHIFDLLTRLRQAVDHPYLVVYSNSSGANANLVDENKSEQECGLCHDPAEDYVVTSCAHVFCKACLIGFSASLGKVTCPTCSKLLTVDWTTKADTEHKASKTTLKGFRASSILNRIKLDDFQTSTKIEALREEIRFMVERDGSAKAIVFSQFTSFLDLINYTLGKCGVSCVQLVGSMTMAARDTAINKFKEDPDCRVFLMSLKAGGVALNLTVASHVFMMDPWWNPAVERQAQDRIHRIGQYKPIRVVRFIIENTVEERILRLQKKKELVFEGTVGGSQEAIGKLTEEDMRFLFTT
ncbi:unnamed protein product [Arabidopsis thaliana]|jgi:DNA repair protein RAD16|nr:Helicase protein with RING/U-box domain-containing protein [Arabidopsis thaliana]AEE27792.1 Helicase protein with RING/U-box domain-containing protein [Arabidopsis thaliana]OAP13344.1 hypothetical protein AXX17_AT1G04500 [Arabidopsis thaliana]CAA0166832.1 unnamed protein product [Arabidopsis thaliana]CAD5311781.1 unnamed protein product [Arabidopsis thaliana]|eukprot:NP_172004.1 Helicase protein with RING/U-box domain-containing protein [Arabidopsis thaliana]